MIMNKVMFFAAIFLMLLIIVKDILRKRYNIDIDKIEVRKLAHIKEQIQQNSVKPVKRSSGNKVLILKNAGANKATVMATLRQITGIDYNSAKNIVENAPSKVLVNVSEEEAQLTKKALEFCGAELQIV